MIFWTVMYANIAIKCRWCLTYSFFYSFYEISFTCWWFCWPSYIFSKNWACVSIICSCNSIISILALLEYLVWKHNDSFTKILVEYFRMNSAYNLYWSIIPAYYIILYMIKYIHCVAVIKNYKSYHFSFVSLILFEYFESFLDHLKIIIFLGCRNSYRLFYWICVLF